MMIWTSGDSQRVRGLPVDRYALSRGLNITQKLVVRRVLLVDENDVFDLIASIPGLARNRIVRIVLSVGLEEPVIGENSFRVC
jgi:hypothetical protein